MKKLEKILNNMSKTLLSYFKSCFSWKRTTLNLYDWLKIIAVLTMIVDHCGFFLFPELKELRLIGRFAFPIFLFLVGFNGKYQWSRSLFLSALVVQGFFVFFDLITGANLAAVWNILISIILVRLFLFGIDSFWRFLENKGQKGKKIWLFIVFFIMLYIVYASISETTFAVFAKQSIDYWLLAFLFWWAGFLLSKAKWNIPLLSMILIGVFCVHYQMMVSSFGFYSGWMKVFLVWGFSLTIVCFLLLKTTKDDNPNLSTNTWLDQIFLFISQNALGIYVLHILLLILFVLWRIKKIR